jgi:hypothetical protein
LDTGLSAHEGEAEDDDFFAALAQAPSPPALATMPPSPTSAAAGAAAAAMSPVVSRTPPVGLSQRARAMAEDSDEDFL